MKECERLLAKLCAHAQHFPITIIALLSNFFALYCNCLLSFTVPVNKRHFYKMYVSKT